jgi:hypothetical protein
MAVVGTAPGGEQATIKVTNTEADGGTDSSIDVEYQFPDGALAGLVGKLASRAIERDLRHSNENFKELCEATVPAVTGA